MSTGFWIRRFAIVFLGAFALIALAQWLKGNSAVYALRQGAIWGLISSSVFIAARVYHSRRGQPCQLCKDTPEMRGDLAATATSRRVTPSRP